MMLTLGALLLIGGNFYDEEPLSLLDVAAMVALADGFAASAYTLIRRRPTRGGTITPPIWHDEQGRRRPVRACSRCGREAPLYRFPIDVVRRVG